MLVILGLCSLVSCPLVVLFFAGAGCHRDLDRDLVEQADILAHLSQHRDNSDWWIPSTPSMRH